MRPVNLSHKQLGKLRQLARQAAELNAEQRARTDAYQKCVEYQSQQQFRINQLKAQMANPKERIKSDALESFEAEIERLESLVEQAKADATDIQKSLQQARTFVGPMNAVIDRITRFVGVSRSELGVSFGARGAPSTGADISL